MHNHIHCRPKQGIKIISLIGLTSLLVLVSLAGCTPDTEPASPANPDPAVQLSDLDVTTGQTIYVPAYSKMHVSRDRTLDLAVTLTVHNSDFADPIILTSVKYYDTQGQLLQEYLAQPLQLGPLAATDFFVDTRDQSGGLGTNFIVEWVAEQPVSEPIVEAIMLHTSNNQGISLTTPGRVISQIAPEENSQ